MERAIRWLTRIGPRSLRVRLALWGLLLLGLTQVVVSIVLYVAISVWLENQVDSNLLLTATQVASVLRDPDEPRNPLDLADIQLQLANTGNIATQSFLRDQMFFVRLVDLSTGTILATSAEFATLVGHTRPGQAYFQTISFSGENQEYELRVYSMPPLEFVPELALQVGISLDQTREIQRDVMIILLVLLLFTGTLAPLSGWFLANRALVPIRAVARTAADINETDLSQRLDLASSEVELAQLVQTFNSMLERIEQAFQRQRQFTADAAHELRTPMSIMQTHLEVTLAQTRSIADYQDALISVQEEVQRLSQLIRMLMMLARADVSELSVSMDTFNLSQLLNAVIEPFSLMAEDKNIALVLDIAPDLMIEGEENRLIQVFYNLVDNAIKYTPQGGCVRLSAQAVDQKIEIRVEDTGPGIPPKERSRIFDRFYRMDSARNRKQGGFGLGLAIAKQIVELHNGTVKAANRQDEGAIFTVTLPRKQPVLVH